MTEEALVGGDADFGAVHLTFARVSPQLPSEFADLSERLGRHGFSKRREATARVDGDLTADGCFTIPQQTFGFASFTNPDVFVPIELERGRKIVHFGEIQIFGADAGFFVRRIRDGVFEANGRGL